jgi:predicted aspartyl protease
MYAKSIALVLLMNFLGLFLWLQSPEKARAEFYSYKDRSGTIIFVDDLSKIPAEYRRQKEVRKDEYDDLPEKERAQLREKDRQEREEARRREQNQQEQSRLRRLEEEQKTASELQRAALTTKVVIAGQQVFVPVKLGNGANETDALLLLDTGATASVITPDVAARLKIEGAENIHVGVVGGRVLKVKKTVLSYIEAGPVRKIDQEAMIIRQRSGEFGDGLLGMSFLGGLKYTIDLKTQTITWIP